MPAQLIAPPKRLLEPFERASEALFGLIMVLTFTGSLSVADAGRGDVRDMLVGALGCNFAWGIIDGIFYLMGCLSDQGRAIRALRNLRGAANDDDARRIIAGELPPAVAEALEPEAYASLRSKLVRSPEPPRRPRLGKDEWLGAVAVFLWVFTATFPVTIPFIFTHDVARAMRLSNGIAMVLMFLTGHLFGRAAGYRPWLSGLAMVVLGGVLVAITIVLGG